MRIWKGVLFVIVNDRSRYCFVARECLLENKKKKERKGEKKRSVYSRHGSWTGIDNSTLRDYLEILASLFRREFRSRIRSTRAIRQKRFSKASEKESGAFLALSLHIDETRETEKIIPESPFPC